MFENLEELKNTLIENESETLFADGFEDAIIGIGEQGGIRKALVVYDRQKCIEILMKRDGMTLEEADEFFEFNTVGSWVGDYTPIFLERMACPSR
jgi:hypothetical protein